MNILGKWEWEEILFYVFLGDILVSSLCMMPPLKWGGLCMYLKLGDEFQIVNAKPDCYSLALKASAVLIENPSTIIITIYRTPVSNYKYFLVSLEK